VRGRTWAILAIAGVAAAGATFFATRPGSASSRDLIVTATVTRRTLDDDVTLTGTLSRLAQRTVTAGDAAQISDVSVDDGSVVQAGSSIIGVNGREAVAEPGAFPFFRPLDVGDTGQDVRQLDEILAGAGYYPGAVSSLYTTQTQFALAQWQAAHGYPGAAPDNPETVTVSLQPSTAYKVGAQNTAGVVIGPPAGATEVAAHTPARDAAPSAVLAAYRTSGAGSAITAEGVSGDVPPTSTTTTTTSTTTTTTEPATTTTTMASTPTTSPLPTLPTTAPPSPPPTLTIDALNAVTAKGSPAVFIVYAATTSNIAVDFNVVEGGDTPADEVLPPTGPFILPIDASSVEVQVPTRVNDLVEPDSSLTLQLIGGTGYNVGNPDFAETEVKSSDVPQISLVGGGSVDRGQPSTIIVSADQAPIQATQIALSVAGDAVPNSDYVPIDPTVTLQPGQTSTTVTLNTLTTDVIQPDRIVVVSLVQGAAYTVGPVNTATITILGQAGNAALPLVTLAAGSHYVTKGSPFPVAIGLSEPMTTSLSIQLTYGGTAVEGVDYSDPAGQITIPAGQTSLALQIPTIADNVVEPDTILLVSLAPSDAYRIGSPSSAATFITSENVPVLTLTAGGDAVGEGGSTTFTITADQPPVKDTSVVFQVVGTAQPGQDYEPLTGTALLRAGQTSVVVVLRTINKDVVFEPTDMIAGSWPIRVGQVLVKAGDIVAPGDPLFTLTDTNFTVTLVASPSDRTQLAVGQSVTVTLQGGDQQATGVISQLDDNVTIDPTTKAQTYMGKISVGDLGAADGAAVSIDVILQDKTNVLTVPIAAVKQNGLGQDVVRVIDLAHGGRVTEARVKTGLADSSYIEIESGLTEGQVVIVETDQTQG